MDVLTSVQKTEESLRKLKKMSHRSSASIPDRGGDDDKIRMQLYFDANYYCKKVRTDILSTLYSEITLISKPHIVSLELYGLNKLLSGLHKYVFSI